MGGSATHVTMIVPSCPKRGDTKLSQCEVCPHFRGLEGVWPHVSVKCALDPVKPRKVELLVACPLKQRHVPFRDCINCPLHRGFYGFHNNSPVVYCGVLARDATGRMHSRVGPIPQLLLAVR